MAEASENPSHVAGVEESADPRGPGTIAGNSGGVVGGDAVPTPPAAQPPPLVWSVGLCSMFRNALKRLLPGQKESPPPEDAVNRQLDLEIRKEKRRIKQLEENEHKLKELQQLQRQRQDMEQRLQQQPHRHHNQQLRQLQPPAHPAAPAGGVDASAHTGAASAGAAGSPHAAAAGAPAPVLEAAGAARAAAAPAAAAAAAAAAGGAAARILPTPDQEAQAIGPAGAPAAGALPAAVEEGADAGGAPAAFAQNESPHTPTPCRCRGVEATPHSYVDIRKWTNFRAAAAATLVAAKICTEDAVDKVLVFNVLAMARLLRSSLPPVSSVMDRCKTMSGTVVSACLSFIKNDKGQHLGEGGRPVGLNPCGIPTGHDPIEKHLFLSELREWVRFGVHSIARHLGHLPANLGVASVPGVYIAVHKTAGEAARAYAPSLGSQAEVEEWLRKGEQRQACFDKDVERLPRLAGSRLELDLGKDVFAWRVTGGGGGCAEGAVRLCAAGAATSLPGLAFNPRICGSPRQRIVMEERGNNVAVNKDVELLFEVSGPGLYGQTNRRSVEGVIVGRSLVAGPGLQMKGASEWCRRSVPPRLSLRVKVAAGFLALPSADFTPELRQPGGELELVASAQAYALVREGPWAWHEPATGGPLAGGGGRELRLVALGELHFVVKLPGSSSETGQRTQAALGAAGGVSPGAGGRGGRGSASRGSAGGAPSGGAVDVFEEVRDACNLLALRREEENRPEDEGEEEGAAAGSSSQAARSKKKKAANGGARGGGRNKRHRGSAGAPCTTTAVSSGDDEEEEAPEEEEGA